MVPGRDLYSKGQQDSIVPQFSNVMKQLFNPHNFLPNACGLEELPTTCIVNFKF